MGKVNKKMFLDNLPKWGKEGMGNEGTINWEESINKQSKFFYNGIKGYVEIIAYEKNTHKLTIKYNEESFIILTDSFKDCKLGKFLKQNTSEFKIEKDTIYKDNKRDITIIDREYRPRYTKDGGLKQNEKWYKYHCNKDGHEDWMVEGNLQCGNGCSACSGNIIIEGINSVVDTHPWMIEFFQGGYDEAKLYNKWGSGNPNNPKGLIHPICPDCGRVKSKKISIASIYQCHSIGCSCGKSISYPNKFAYNLLEQFKIDFETEYSPYWIKPKRYDFYFELNNNKYILEMDGSLGHGKNNYKNNMTSEESKIIDDYKDEQARLHGIEVIRINCNYGSNDRFEYIKKNILNSKLNLLFNLSKIDWLKIEKFCYSNLVKYICEYKKQNSNMTTTEIGKIFKLSNTTIATYLKKGNTFGWCTYNGYDEFIKNNLRNSEKNRIRNGKPVEIFKNYISLGIFTSCIKLDEQSEELFETKLDNKSISAVCIGSRKIYKGFTFKYISKEEYEQRIQSEAKLNKAI